MNTQISDTTSSFDERAQLLPVCNNLHLDEREMEMVRMNITAQAPQGNQDQKGEGSSLRVG
uniref:Uncharacterized protein n=1 Tax=Meloidogyne incognita TaxID=6306 RepID=A0A914N9B7_MELIC